MADNKNQNFDIPLPIFDVRKSNIHSREAHERYISLHKYQNFGSPASLHFRDINETYFSRDIYDPELYKPHLIPPNLKEDVYILSDSSKVIDDCEKVLDVKVDKNRATITILRKDNTTRIVKICFCDEDNYNILRIADQVHNDDREVVIVTNGDYVYPGGGVFDREFTKFNGVVSCINPDIELKTKDSVDKNIGEVKNIWDDNRFPILKQFSRMCLSSEENVCLYSNLLDIIKFTLPDLLYVREPTPEGITMKELNEIPAVKDRNIFCGTFTKEGTPKFTKEDYENLIGKFPLLWKPKVAKYFDEFGCLFIGDMTIFSNYKYELLESPWKAHSIYAVGPLWHNRDYDDDLHVISFVKEYNKLIRNIICTDFIGKTKKDKVLITSIIGGRFQLLKQFNNIEYHSDEDIQNLIKNSDTDRLKKLGDEFAKKMRQEHLIKCFINNIPNSAYDEIYVSITPGSYRIFYETLVVEKFDGPNGKGTPYLQ